MIPVEAVEAAMDAIFRTTPNLYPPSAKVIAQTALEAAAPYMLAEAFDQGQKSGMRHADRLVAAAKIGKPELPGPLSPNPYMLNNEGEK